MYESICSLVVGGEHHVFKNERDFKQEKQGKICDHCRWGSSFLEVKANEQWADVHKVLGLFNAEIPQLLSQGVRRCSFDEGSEI